MADSSAPWYADGLRFACQTCGACCRVEGYVWVDEESIRLLADHLGLSLDDFGRQYLRRAQGRYSLIERPNHECVFWNDGCEVYELRPPQCRTFPFWPELVTSPEDWADVATGCHGIGDGRLYGVDEIEGLRTGQNATDDGEPAARECGCADK